MCVLRAVENNVEAVLHKTGASHLTNHQRKTVKTRWTLLKKARTNNKATDLVNSHT